MPRKARTHYVMVGTFKGTDGQTYSVKAPTGSKNPEDVQYQATKKRIARAIIGSPKYDGHSTVVFRIEGE